MYYDTFTTIIILFGAASLSANIMKLIDWLEKGGRHENRR